jgi:hypothetical protein
MDFLKLLFGEKALTYSELEQAINAHNGNEANKDNQIKIGNLGGGAYVGKAKHDALQALLDGKTAELDTANTLIADLKKNAKGDEALQSKVTAYETQVAQLQEKLRQTQIDSGLRIALMEAGGAEIDYLIWKAKTDNGGKPFELTDDGKIRGIDDTISGLKTSSPNHFKKAGGVKVEENPLPSGNNGKVIPQTLADALRLQYENN